VCGGGGGSGGGVEMYCGPYSAGVLHSVSDQIQNLPNCFNKMTSEDDIKGLVSLKFLRPWYTSTVLLRRFSLILVSAGPDPDIKIYLNLEKGQAY
jgi:hypothetical protein